ncbi:MULTISPECIES: DUF4191 domain-containing protein [Tessaracoccus]|uniref:DUF4191 domain-containing protein n=1 Tax=Tessaracoccus TaxID=72763 RepID=UPI0009C30CCA|nr:MULTISPECIES: DUF4191 domain-containing protein [Tessaracoccus]AQX16640.1 hypothetical protein BKM78_12525 [Tessaracoccus sp. T2.5-30]VEP41352.1 hypothetical protein TLA_TLA_02522 [Tessaracoccus lapidicaptus]
MASEKAKALAAKQKAELKAAKLAKKNSTNPADWGWWRQLRETYRITVQYDTVLPWLMLAGFVVPFVALLILGIVLDAWIVWGIVGISAGVLGALSVFTWRARKAVYRRFDGQAGSAEVALQMLPKKWISTPVITATRQLDAVHRTLGPGGLVLIGEGDPGRLKPLLASEKKKHEQVAYGVDVIIVQMGKGSGQIPLDKLADHIKKLPNKLSAAKITEVNQRLRALDAMRPKAPIPRGPIQMKGARSAMRGR